MLKKLQPASAGRELPESSTDKDYKKILANNFPLLDREDTSPGPSTEEEMTHFPLLLFAVSRKS